MTSDGGRRGGRPAHKPTKLPEFVLRREGSTFELMDEPGWRRFNARRD